MAHELVQNYHKQGNNPNCALKVDLRMAYDSVEWDFLEEVMASLNFLPNSLMGNAVCLNSKNLGDH